MFGKRRDDGGARGTSEVPATPASDGGPRMYRADSTMAPAPRAPAPAEPARRAPDVTATTGRRAEVKPSAPGDTEGKKLIVGREIALSGEIRACDLLVVEGRVEAVLSDSRAIEVSATGVFKGKAQIEFRRDQRCLRRRAGHHRQADHPFHRPRLRQYPLRPDRDRPRRHHRRPDRRARHRGWDGIRHGGARSRRRRNRGYAPRQPRGS